MSADSDGFCKEDPVQKAPDYEEKILAEIDPVTVEISGEDFKELLAGTDMPPGQRVQDFSDIAFLELASKAEDLLYDPLCDRFNSIAKKAGYQGSFKVTATHFETKENDFRCDIALYPDEPLAKEAYSRDIENANPHIARCAWAWMVTPIEVKCRDEDAAYGFEVTETDKEGRTNIPLFRDTPKGRSARAQFVKYASEIMMRQHRTHVFGIYITGAAVRFARFDRSGCVVSAPIHLQDNFVLFRDIMYRLLRLSQEDQGFDNTVSLASDGLLRRLRANQPLKNPHLKKYYQDCFNADKRLYPIYKVICPAVDIRNSPDIVDVDDEGSAIPPPEREYLIGKPTSAYPSPTGRCTRGYVAFDVETQCFVFLKDQWRAVTRKSELDTYRRLHQHRITCIATPIAGGDISTHRTKNHHFMRHRELRRRPVERVHCRLVTQEVGLSLETYRGTYDLLRYVTCAVAAHMDAWLIAGVLHHDVSAGNIMINTERDTSFLNDWDLAKWREELVGGTNAAEPAGVSGTWPYKAALALEYPFKPAEVADDIESFIYILLFMAMRFHRHNYSSSAPKGASLAQQKAANAKNVALAVRFFDIFHQADLSDDGYYVGGYWKSMAIAARRVPIELAPDPDGKPTPLARVLQQCYDLMHDHYRQINYDELKQYAVNLQGKQPADEPGTSPKNEDTDEMGETSHDPNMVVCDLLTTVPLENDISFYKKRNRQQRRSSRSSSGRSSMDDGGLRPMDDHESLLTILRDAFMDENGKPIPIMPYRNDKLYDQCLNQLVMTSSRRKNFSGASLKDDLAKKSPSPHHSGSAGSSVGTLPAIAEVPEPGAEDDAASDDTVGPPARTTRARASRKTTAAKNNAQRSKKTTVARKDSPPRKAQAAKQAKVARKAAAVEKAMASRKPKAPTKTKTKTTPVGQAPGKGRTAAAGKTTTASKTTGAKKATSRTAATGAVRRSARLATEETDVPPAPATGKRKRAALVEDPVPEPVARPRKATEKPSVAKKPVASKAAAKAAPTRKAKAAQAVPAPPARRSSRLAARA